MARASYLFYVFYVYICLCIGGVAEMKLKFRAERTEYLFGFGIYVSKKTHSLLRTGEVFYGPSLVFHIAKRSLRVWWIMEEKK